MKFFFNFSSSHIIDKKNIKRFIREYARQDNWHEHELDAKKGNLGYGWLHYALIRNLKPDKVLIIGSRYGYIPAICALACKHNQTGIVDLVDAGYDQNNPTDKYRHWGGVGFWKKIDPNHHFARFKLNQHIRVHIMTSQKFYDLNKHSSWQYIYLDGDHSYQGIKTDFTKFWPQLKKEGFLALHDIHIESLGGFKFGTKKLWKELKKKKDYNAIEISGKFGLGILQK